MVSHPFKRIKKGHKDTIIFSTKDHKYNLLNNKPLYVEAKINELVVKRALLDNGASMNLMPKHVFKALLHGQEHFVPLEVTFFGFTLAQSKIIWHIIVNLKVGPSRSPTRFHVFVEKTSYHLLLGRPWIHIHNCIPSTLHQCLKANIKGQTIHVSVTKAPFTLDEVHLAEAILFDEAALAKTNAITQP